MLYGLFSDSRSFFDAPMAMFSWVFGIQHYTRNAPGDHVWPVILGIIGFLALMAIFGIAFAALMALTRTTSDAATLAAGIVYALVVWAIVRYADRPDQRRRGHAHHHERRQLPVVLVALVGNPRARARRVLRRRAPHGARLVRAPARLAVRARLTAHPASGSRAGPTGPARRVVSGPVASAKLRRAPFASRSACAR
jgi:hypothetical protein